MTPSPYSAPGALPAAPQPDQQPARGKRWFKITILVLTLVTIALICVGPLTGWGGSTSASRMGSFDGY